MALSTLAVASCKGDDTTTSPTTAVESDTGKYIKKKASNKLVDKAKVLVLSQSQITTLNLHDIFFNDFEEYIDSNKVGIVKTILVPQLE